MKSANAELRLDAIDRYSYWVQNYWGSLVDHQLETLVDASKVLVKNMLNVKSVDCQVKAIGVLGEIIQTRTETHQFISALCEGDESFKDRKPDSISVSELISSPKSKVREQFVLLLRICNRTTKVKWNHVCSQKKVTKTGCEIGTILIWKLPHF